MFSFRTVSILCFWAALYFVRSLIRNHEKHSRLGSRCAHIYTRLLAPFCYHADPFESTTLNQAVKQSLFPPSTKDFSKAHSFVLGSTQVEDAVEWGEIDMDNSSVLEQFIAQGKAKYPAENYILLISGHGGGLQRGFGGDVDSFRQRGGKYLYDPIGMSIPELVQGLSGGMGDDKFALMAFDAGLMQDFGVAYAVAPYTDLYLASQDALADL